MGTSTPEMKILVALSSVAAFVQAIALIGWITAKVDAGIVQTGFIGMDPPITSIVFFAAAFCVPTALVTPVAMFTHWKPKFVLLGSQQLTDSLRGQFAAPFRMKYLYGVMAFVNGIALVSLKYKFFWPAAFNMLNIALYSAGLALVFKHFQNENVPTDLATTAGSMIGSTAAIDAGRLDALERDVKILKQELEALKEIEALKIQNKTHLASTSAAPSGPLPSVWGAVFGSKGESASEGPATA